MADTLEWLRRCGEATNSQSRCHAFESCSIQILWEEDPLLNDGGIPYIMFVSIDGCGFESRTNFE